MPREIPSWGRVTAAPHEFLLHLRDGVVLRGQQGGSCFKWPSDTVARVDTSVRRLQFTADQVTREKTGVQVTGLAVFRIVEPLLAYRMLNLEDPDAHADILREMLLGATRRLVANLTLEECLTRRKDALGAELMAEIAPVVSGRGRAEDTADRGWGIGIDTIEIQDVRVLSEEVFSRLQAAYRESLALDALRAREDVLREEARLAHERAQEEERRSEARLRLEEARIAAERKRQVDNDAHQRELAHLQQASKLARERERQEHDVALHLIRADAQNEAAAREAATQRRLEEARAESERRLAEARAASEVDVARKTAEAERLLGEARAELERAARAARDTISDARLRELLVTQTLPEVARAYADSFDRIVVTGASDLSVLGQGVAQVLATARALGVSLPGDPT